MADEKFLGRGMKFPPQIDAATGRFKVSEGKENIKESIYLILMTQKTERWLRPNYGSSIMSYTFMDTNNTMLSMMARDIKNDIMKNEPRVEDVRIEIDAVSKEGYLMVGLDYYIIGENTRDNMIFPFYLDVK